MTPPSAVPIVHDRYSPARSLELASARSAAVTRFGSPAYEAGRKKPVAKPGGRGEDDDRPGLFVKGRAAKMPSRRQVGDDHDPPAREPVDQRAEQQADGHRRQEVRDEQRAHPRRRAGPVVDVDRQRDDRDPGSEARRERRSEEQPGMPGLRRSRPGCRWAGAARHAATWTLPLCAAADDGRKSPVENGVILRQSPP